MTPLRVLVVGRGKVAHALHHAAHARPVALTCRLRALNSVRGADLTWAEVLLLAVPDGAIAGAAATLAARVERLPVLHLSGSRSVDEAGACREHGALHPLASFASQAAPPDLEGVHFALGGTAAARRMGRRVVLAVGGHVLGNARGRGGSLQGPAYHAAAALVANGAAALAAGGVDILTRLGVTRPASQRAIAGLLRSVAHNVERVGVPAALTGPVMRGDAGTVRDHRAALSQLEGSGLDVYDAVAMTVLGCAEDAGLGTDASEEIRRALTARTPRP